MNKIILAITTVLLLMSCDSMEDKTVDQTDRMELVPEPDKASREEFEKWQKLRTSCVFLNPDTSVFGINLRDAKSVLHVLGSQTKLNGDSIYRFCSSDKKQELQLTVQAGDFPNQVSMFTIFYSDDGQQNIRKLDSKVFETEKGIKLGISRKELIQKLGTCFITKDSTKNSVAICYRISLPDDSKTKLLTNHNMPVYFATYRLINNRVKSIHFGFEYP